jgi:DNA invertase Pin-like site-specific DNA recombinase
MTIKRTLPLRSAGYVRTSTDRQDAKRQRAEIQKLAARENCDVVAWYEDHGEPRPLGTVGGNGT